MNKEEIQFCGPDDDLKPMEEIRRSLHLREMGKESLRRWTHAMAAEGVEIQTAYFTHVGAVRKGASLEAFQAFWARRSVAKAANLSGGVQQEFCYLPAEVEAFRQLHRVCSYCGAECNGERDEKGQLRGRFALRPTDNYLEWASGNRLASGLSIACQDCMPVVDRWIRDAYARDHALRTDKPLTREKSMPDGTTTKVVVTDHRGRPKLDMGARSLDRLSQARGPEQATIYGGASESNARPGKPCFDRTGAVMEDWLNSRLHQLYPITEDMDWVQRDDWMAERCRVPAGVRLFLRRGRGIRLGSKNSPESVVIHPSELF